MYSGLRAEPRRAEETPPRHALEPTGMTTAQKLSLDSEKEIVHLHGMGKSSLPKLRDALHAAGLSFTSTNTIMDTAFSSYQNALLPGDKEIADLLAATINDTLPEATCKIWHAHPVWFINDNPIVGYSKQKKGMRLMFWSGADFDEAGLNVPGEKFKDASVFYNAASDIHVEDLRRWLQKSREIQWDYKNLIKRKGKLEKINL